MGRSGNSGPYCHLTNCMTICCNCIALSAYSPENDGTCMTFSRPGGRPPVGMCRKKIGTGLLPPGSPGGFLMPRAGRTMCAVGPALGWSLQSGLKSRSGAKSARFLRHPFCAGLRAKAAMPQGKDNPIPHALMVKGCWIIQTKDSKRNHIPFGGCRPVLAACSIF